MADWTTLGAGMVGAAAAIAGSVGGQVFRSRSDMSRETKERHLRFRDMRRSAYADLLSVSSRLIWIVDSNKGQPPPHDIESLHDALHRAAALAELYAEPQNWEQMRGLLTIAQLKIDIATNTAGHDATIRAASRLSSLGADTQEGIESWRDQYVSASRTDLSI